MPLKASPLIAAYDWSGFYVGGHLGYAWGSSNWAATGADGNAFGSLNLSRGIDFFSEYGSWNEGVQLGYNTMLGNRMVLGVEADFTFPALQDLSGISTGNAATYAGGNVSYTDTLLASGTIRGRIGYAPGNWLFYGTAAGRTTAGRLGRGRGRRISDIRPLDRQGRVSLHAIQPRHGEFTRPRGPD